MTTTQLIHFAIAMVTITNPVGNLAIYAGLTGDNSAAERRHMAIDRGHSRSRSSWCSVVWAGRLHHGSPSA